MEDHPLYYAFQMANLLDEIKLAYDPCCPKPWSNQIMSAVLVKPANFTQNSPFSPMVMAVAISSTPTHGWMAKLSWPGWLGQIPRWYTHKQSPIPVLIGPNIEQLCWSRQMHYH